MEAKNQAVSVDPMERHMSYLGDEITNQILLQTGVHTGMRWITPPANQGGMPFRSYEAIIFDYYAAEVLKAHPAVLGYRVISERELPEDRLRMMGTDNETKAAPVGNWRWDENMHQFMYILVLPTLGRLSLASRDSINLYMESYFIRRFTDEGGIHQQRPGMIELGPSEMAYVQEMERQKAELNAAAKKMHRR